LGGKIVGIGTLGVGQFAGTVAVALIAINATDAIDLPSFTAETLFHLVFWFLVGFLIYAFMFGAAGSLVSRPEDAQNIAFPMTLAAVASFFLSIISLDDPEGVAATVGTFIPLTAPFVVPVRAALDAIPLWQYAVSALLAFAGAAALMFIGGRIYSGAVLRYGGRVRYRDAWRGGA
jgi:ABC-2 type transport system permease protein